MTANVTALLYLVAGALFILALRGLSSPETSRRGNLFGMLGMAIAIGTTLAALALARELSRHARVVLVDLAFAHPNLAAVAVDPSAPGIADLVRGGASFGAIITRDRDSRALRRPPYRVRGRG